MHLREGEYEKAHTDFFEAFKNYDESGSPRWVDIISTYVAFTESGCLVKNVFCSVL